MAGINYFGFFTKLRSMQATEKKGRIDYLINFFQSSVPNTPIHLLIPSAVKQDYQPSGKITASTIPVLLLTGILGMGIGYGVSWLISSAGIWVFEAFDEAGFCLNIIYLPAGLLYILAPLAIAYGGGMGIAGGGPLSSCRSPKVGAFAGVVIGLASAAAAIYVTYGLFDGLNFIGSVLDRLQFGVSTILTMIGLGLFYWLTMVADHYVWFGILTLLSILLAYSMGREAGTSPYCEQAHKFLDKHVIRNVKINELPRLLIGLLNRDEQSLTELKQVSKNAKERIDVSIWTAEGHHTNLIEVEAHYQKVEYTRKGEKKSGEQRLLLSESLDKSALEEVANLLKVDLKKIGA